MLKLKLQYFGPLVRRGDSLERPDPGKDWRQEVNSLIEDEMVGWHHELKGHEFAQAPGDGEGQEPCVVYFMELQRIRYNLASEQ